VSDRPDGIRVRIIVDGDSHGERDRVLTLSYQVAQRLIENGRAIETDEEEAGTVRALLDILGKRPSTLVDLAFGAALEVEQTETLLRKLIDEKRVARTVGSKYTQVFWRTA